MQCFQCCTVWPSCHSCVFITPLMLIGIVWAYGGGGFQCFSQTIKCEGRERGRVSFLSKPLISSRMSRGKNIPVLTSNLEQTIFHKGRICCEYIKLSPVPFIPINTYTTTQSEQEKQVIRNLSQSHFQMEKRDMSRLMIPKIQ